MGDKANNIVLSPITDNWQNLDNSENISQGFVTSTKKPQTDDSENQTIYESSEILFPQRKRQRSNNNEAGRSTSVASEQLISLNISPFLEDTTLNYLNESSTSCRSTDLHESQKSSAIPENILLDKMNTIITKISNLERNMEKRENENQNHRNAQNKTIMETLIHVKKMNQSLSRLVGGQEDSSVEFETIFPIKLVAELSDMELRLIDRSYIAKLVMFLRKLTGSSSVESVFRYMATDNVYHEFNLNGRAGKRTLNSLKLFNAVLFDACGGLLGRETFESEVRKCVQHAHNRFF